MTIAQQTTAIESFYAAVMRGVEAWKEAGRIVSEAIEADPEFADKIQAKHPEITAETILAFERIGKNQLSPRLLICDAPGYVALRDMPIAEQERCLKGPVRLLVKAAAGYETLQADAANLTALQAKQVFDTKQKIVRSEAAQRAWIEDTLAKRAAPVACPNSPFRVVGKKLIISEACQLSARDLARALAEMES